MMKRRIITMLFLAVTMGAGRPSIAENISSDQGVQPHPITLDQALSLLQEKETLEKAVGNPHTNAEIRGVYQKQLEIIDNVIQQNQNGMINAALDHILDTSNPKQDPSILATTDEDVEGNGWIFSPFNDTGNPNTNALEDPDTDTTRDRWIKDSGFNETADEWVAEDSADQTDSFLESTPEPATQEMIDATIDRLIEHKQ